MTVALTHAYNLGNYDDHCARKSHKQNVERFTVWWKLLKGHGDMVVLCHTDDSGQKLHCLQCNQSFTSNSIRFNVIPFFDHSRRNQHKEKCKLVQMEPVPKVLLQPAEEKKRGGLLSVWGGAAPRSSGSSDAIVEVGGSSNAVVEAVAGDSTGTSTDVDMMGDGTLAARLREYLRAGVHVREGHV
eukprot:4005160-Prymnesium_polylepis.1